MGFTPLRPQQYRVAWPLTPGQVENIDTMFETLFKRLRAVDITASANAAGSGDFDGKHLGEVVGRFPESAFTGEDGEMGIPGVPGIQGPQGLKGNPGYDGEPGEDGIGFSGATGVVGPAGIQGFPGQDGQDGDDATGSFQPSNVVSALFTQGSIIFAGPSGRLAQNNSKVFWDDANFRLGIGTAAPTTSLDVSGVGNPLLAQNTNATGLGTSNTLFRFACRSNASGVLLSSENAGDATEYDQFQTLGGKPIWFGSMRTALGDAYLSPTRAVSINTAGDTTTAGLALANRIASVTWGVAVDNSGHFYVRDDTNTVIRLKILTSTGQMGVGGITSPTAMLHLPAGTATASTAPLKFTSGTVLGTPEAGTIEYDGTDFFLTP